jgi:hypothetical protein
MKHLRNGLVTAGCAAFISVTCFGQTVPSFTTAISASGPAPSHVYAVDVNNDGLTDILQDSASPGITGSFFSVSINTGKGLFAPPINYKINSTTWTPLTWGDFNNDGKVDIAVVLSGTNFSAARRHEHRTALRYHLRRIGPATDHCRSRFQS